MRQAIDFYTQADLENVLFKLQTLIAGSSILILDQAQPHFVYEFKAQNFNHTLFQTLKQKVQANELTIGRHIIKDASKSIELLCHSIYYTPLSPYKD